VYLDCAVESAAESGSYGDAGERGNLIEDAEPDRECDMAGTVESGGTRGMLNDMMKYITTIALHINCQLDDLPGRDVR
jgi:hypothetical protein